MANSSLKEILNYKPGISYGIGVTGENLTVVILSLNRAQLTLKLLNSFALHLPFFQGKFLIIDNGSNQNTKQALKTYQANSAQHINLIFAKTNLGIAGGRNYALEFVQTEWLMFLDNDIYLDGSFLPLLHREINYLGAHFVSLPLKNPNGTFFAKGGKLYLTNINHEFIHIGGGNANATLDAAENSCFLYGGASVVNANTFRQLGLFNQNLFIGFEDTEFSLRLWKQGYKVGISSAKCFIHDHQQATNVEEIAYEKQRFSALHILRSAQYAEEKHYLGFLSEHDLNWLQEKLTPLNVTNAVELKNFITKKNQTPTKKLTHNLKTIKVAIITDVINWAFANIAFNLINNNQHEEYLFEFKVIPHHDPLSFNDNAFRILLATEDCTIIHFMWRAHLFSFEQNLLSCIANLELQKIKQQFFDSKIISTCVYDHQMLPHDNTFIHKNFTNLVKNNYYVASEKLNTIYSLIDGIEKPRAICPDGVDLKLFKPQNLSRFVKDNLEKRTINLGWIGNSRWGGIENDHKGLYTIIQPAINQLIAEGYNIKFSIADRNIQWREQHTMPEFYNTLDIMLCASINEGTPNSVLEAMACGLAIITTDVGIVNEALGAHQKNFIVERSVVAFYEKIKYLLDHKELLYRLSQENLTKIKSYDWSYMARNLLNYFKELTI